MTSGKYEYIGADGSMGLRTGQIKFLTITENGGYIFAEWDAGGYWSKCPYGSGSAFNKCWRFVPPVCRNCGEVMQ